MIYQLGRLVRDVELKEIDINGERKKVLNNALAVKVDKDTTAFIDISAWGSQAENISKYFHKGDELVLKGEIRNRKRKIEDKEITTVFMLVTGFEFTYGNKKNTGDSIDDESPFEE